MSKLSNYAIALEFKEGYKLGKLKAILKGKFNFWFFQFWRKDVRKLLSELKYFPNEVLEYLMMVSNNINSIEEFKIQVNWWLELESKMVESESLVYRIGNAKEVFKLVDEKRQAFYKECFV